MKPHFTTVGSLWFLEGCILELEAQNLIGHGIASTSALPVVGLE